MKINRRVGAQHAAPAKREYPVGARYIVPDISPRNPVGANRIRPAIISKFCRSAACRLTLLIYQTPERLACM
jgi:hypothetical protein